MYRVFGGAVRVRASERRDARAKERMGARHVAAEHNQRTRFARIWNGESSFAAYDCQWAFENVLILFEKCFYHLMRIECENVR